MAPYRLANIYSGHSKDVRCIDAVQCPDSVRLVSGSRDCSVKLWNQGREELTFFGHSKYVSAIVAREPNDEFAQGLVYTGSHDGWLRVFSPGSAKALYEVEAHSDTISSLYVSKVGTLISGSWDQTAKVWLEKIKPTMTLTGHEAAVWAVCILPGSGFMLTGSADKQLRMWRAGKCVFQQNDAHSQAVRSIKHLDEKRFVTCGNDGYIRLWRVNDQAFDLIQAIHAHENFLYCMAILPANVEENTWVVGGENSGLKIFAGDREMQILNLPAISVWCVTALPNGDIAAGCSDGKIWIFSNQPERQADQDLQGVYELELSKFQRPAQTELEGIDTAALPGPNALLAPGTRDGQTKMVKDGAVISVHSWSEGDQKWSKVGDVVGQPGQKTNGAAPDGGKVTFEGREYDFVFDIDIEDGVILKLPYNRTDDAWMTAQQFIYKHNLPQVYLDTIARHIIKNSGGGESATPLAGGAADPFTGAGAYTTSGQSSVAQSSNLGGAGDPFTGSGAYTTRMEVDEPKKNHFPQAEFLSFPSTPNYDAMTKKLKEFNEKVPEAKDRLLDSQIARLKLLCSKEFDCDADDIVNLLQALRWPEALCFPALDVLRCAVLNPKTHTYVFNDDLIDDFVSLLFANMAESAPENCKMLALRAFANMFSVERGLKALMVSRDSLITRLTHLLPSPNKNVQVAIATILLNFSIASLSQDQEECQVQCVTSIGMLFLEGLGEPEAIYRCLVALGTLILRNEANISLAKDVQARERVHHWSQVGPSKVQECAKAILAII